MAAVGIFCLAFCLLAFLFRKMIFSYLGGLAYKLVLKSVASSAGKISAVEKVEDEEVDNLLFLNLNKRYRDGFILNVKMIGQNFDLNAPENIKYSTPSPLQDLFGKNNLA